MNIEGAEWDHTTEDLVMNNEISIPLKPVLFTWFKVEKSNQVAENEIMVPVYLNKSRKNLLFSIKVYFQLKYFIFFL